MEPNLFGTLILKQKRIHYKYDWFLLGYYKEVEILKKVKPKTEDGRTFFYYKHAEDDVTGDVYVLCGIKSKIKKDEDPWKAYKEYVILKFNSQLELVKESSFTFEYPQTIAFSRSIEKPNPEDPENAGVSGMAFVFA
ncbi:MAG TPA: hypothetical protein DCQ31_02955, partial [Bacteroidales bacterium]|nr:hypothetical protein [Bacteroidales bacterium]